MPYFFGICVVSFVLGSTENSKQFDFEVYVNGTIGDEKLSNQFTISCIITNEYHIKIDNVHVDAHVFDYRFFRFAKGLVFWQKPLENSNYELKITQNDPLEEKFNCKFEDGSKLSSGIIKSTVKINVTCEATERICFLIEGLKFQEISEENFVAQGIQGLAGQNISIGYRYTRMNHNNNYFCFEKRVLLTNTEDKWGITWNFPESHDCEVHNVNEEDLKFKQFSYDIIASKIKCKRKLN